MSEVGYCEHSDCPDPSDLPDGPNAKNRRGDQFFCDDHIGSEDVERLLDEIEKVLDAGSPADQLDALYALLERNGRKVL